ncbi:MAG: FAD-dependent oxidoreductase [Armatimonadota bacterium]|nr:FAD-dependent oxidoreductase [Armatimonadota bacterium]MDW8025625.1 FAD-dependent oxidoreductase [Armatimonadota bacterium]
MRLKHNFAAAFLITLAHLSMAFAQWSELDEAGNAALGQWLPMKLVTPVGELNGWQTQTRTKDAHYLVTSFEPTRKVVEVEFVVKTPRDGERGLTFGLSKGIPTHWTSEAVRLIFGSSGYISQRDIGGWFTWRSTFSWVTTIKFPGDEWISVRIVADPTIGAYKLWLSRVGTSQIEASWLLPFLSPVDELSCFFFFNGESDGGQIQVSEPTVKIGALPNAPKSLRVKPAEGKLVLKWQPSETHDVHLYRIYRRGVQVAEVPANTLYWEDETVNPNEGYSYFVTALSDASESLPSWSDAAMTLPQPRPSLKGAPAKLVADYDCVVVGATPAGIAAAITLARRGWSVALVERTKHIGGMMTSGLSATDRRYRQASGGLFAEFVSHVEKFYREAYGAGSLQHRQCQGGYLFEPKVAEQVFWLMLSMPPIQPDIYLMQGLGGLLKDGNRVTEILLDDRVRGLRWRMRAQVFIDATYEGDLAALSGAAYRVGREGRFEFNEEFAGEVFWDSLTRQVTFGRPDGDRKVQAYNYRLTLTRRPDNRRPLTAPPDYNPQLYAEIATRVKDKVIWHPMEVVSLVKLPQLKFDANNTPGPFPSTDFIGMNYDYPEADWEKREEIAAAHRNYILGLLYFLQTDERLPDWFRAAASHWGLAADEFEDNDNFPPQLYVREARRIIGDYIFTERDARPQSPGKRAPTHEDSIAVAEYPIDSHACTPREPFTPYIHEGFFYLPNITAPSHIPYRVMLPKEKGEDGQIKDGLEGLLVCVAVSATHIGFGTLRLEPVWMALGQAAGTAAGMALVYGSTRKVPIDKLQRSLLEQGQVISFFFDMPPKWGIEFAAAQFFAVRGFFETYEARLKEALDNLSVANILQRFSNLFPLTNYEPFASANANPTEGEVIKWLAKCLRCTEEELLKRCGSLLDFNQNEPIRRGKLLKWLYMLTLTQP